MDASSAGEAASRRAWLAATMVGGAGLAVAGLARATPSTAPMSSLSARDFGAAGDGVADDTAALQAALDASTTRPNSSLHLPAGRYRMTRSLTLARCDRFDLFGDGASTTLLHEADEPLLLWPARVPCRESSLRHLCIASTGAPKSPATPALLMAGGIERSLLSHLLFISEGAPMGSGIVVEGVADTSTFEHCLMWGPIGGTGIRIPRGSEVRIVGGRILGSPDPFKGLNPGNVGIHLTGGNGGVHIVTTDLIGLGTSLKIGEPGWPSNREIFLTHCTIDSSVRGLLQVDNAYTSIVGCWAASCDEAQVLIDESCGGAIVSISGGSIFNGGTYGRPGGHHGMVVRSGAFNLTGVNVRHNKGVGLHVSPAARDYVVNGCRFHDNGIGAILDGRGYAFSGNVLARNREQLIQRGTPAEGQLTGNVQIAG